MNGVLRPGDNSGHIRHITYQTLMRSGNNTHVEKHKTNMINEEWNKTQNYALFVAFYDISAVTFVLPDETADVSSAGLQWFILIPQLNHIGFL